MQRKLISRGYENKVFIREHLSGKTEDDIKEVIISEEKVADDAGESKSEISMKEKYVFTSDAGINYFGIIRVKSGKKGVIVKSTG